MRRLGMTWGVPLALILVIISHPVASAAEVESYYLGPEGIPHGELLLNPLGGELPNYDLGRDVEPGLLLERSDLGLDEGDETKFQHWQIEVSGERLVGYPSAVIWGAADRFEEGKHGVFTVYLLDCDRSATECNEIESRLAAVDSGRGGYWVETTIDFPAVDHRFGEGRYLGVRIVVSAASDGAMIFAYGNTKQRSRLTIHVEPPARTVETTVAAWPPPMDDVAMTVSAQAEEAPVAEGPTPIPAVSLWPWLITLVLSTALLVALGAVLMASLTKPGRHERLLGGVHVAVGNRTRRSSISVG